MGEICSTMPSATCTPRSDPVLFRKEAHGVYFEVSYADIYNEKTDIIVNPSNTQLMHNIGLSRTLVERAGSAVRKECSDLIKQFGILKIGQVVSTGGGNLRCKLIFHAVFPIWLGGTAQEVENLAEGIKNILTKAEQLKATSVAFPVLGGGVFGIPLEIAAKTIVCACLEYLQGKRSGNSIVKIRFVHAGPRAAKYYYQACNSLLGIGDITQVIKDKTEASFDNSFYISEVCPLPEEKKTIRK